LVTGSAKFRPTPIIGDTKYGTKGGCTAELLAKLELPPEIAESVAKYGNLAVTKSTWSTYRSAKAMLTKCQTGRNTDLSLPFNERKALIFIDWMAREKNLRHATISSYLAGVRQLHIINGIEPPNFRSGLVKLVLKGIENNDGIKKRQSNYTGRLPMTPSMLLVFKELISASDRNSHDKRLIWAVATLAFAGAFRIGELLAKLESTFDPNFTLLTKDVTWSTDKKGDTILHVCLKCPKENKTASPTVVDIYQNRGPLCPVKAFMAWRKLTHRDPDLPLFRNKLGTPLTGAKMNSIIHLFLDPYTDKSVGTFGTHSFRIGLASMLGNLGCPDDDIMASGRWSSRAFELYVKLKRTKRSLMGKKISKMF
jgi:integrase